MRNRLSSSIYSLSYIQEETLVRVVKVEGDMGFRVVGSSFTNSKHGSMTVSKDRYIRYYARARRFHVIKRVGRPAPPIHFLLNGGNLKGSIGKGPIQVPFGGGFQGGSVRKEHDQNRYASYQSQADTAPPCPATELSIKRGGGPPPRRASRGIKREDPGQSKLG